MSRKIKRKRKTSSYSTDSDKKDTVASSFRAKFAKSKKKLANRDKKKKKVLSKPRCAYFDPITGKQCRKRALRGMKVCADHGNLKKVPIPSYANPYANMSKFKPEFHPMEFIRLSHQGLSDVEIAAEFEVGKDTIKNWSETHSEFALAYDIGKTIEEAFYVRSGRNNLANSRFNTSLFKFMTGNRLGYAEKIESKNLNMNVSGVLKVPAAMSDSEWEEADFTESDEEK